MTEQRFENETKPPHQNDGKSPPMNPGLAEVLEDYKIGDKVVKLPGGFQRIEPPEQRTVFPNPDLTKNLVPKGSPDASSGAAPISPADKARRDVERGIGDIIGLGVRLGARITDNLTKDKPWDDFGKDRTFIGRLKDLSRPVNRRYQLEGQ